MSLNSRLCNNTRKSKEEKHNEDHNLEFYQYGYFFLTNHKKNQKCLLYSVSMQASNVPLRAPPDIPNKPNNGSNPSGPSRPSPFSSQSALQPPRSVSPPRQISRRNRFAPVRVYSSFILSEARVP